MKIVKIKSSFMRYYCDEGNWHHRTYLALTEVGLVPGPVLLYGTRVTGWKESLKQPAAGSEQVWSEPAQLLVLCMTPCRADTSAESFCYAANFLYFLWFVISKVGKNRGILRVLSSEVKVIIIFMACRSGWGKRRLPSSLQHFFLKNTGVAILQLNVSLLTCRFQV